MVYLNVFKQFYVSLYSPKDIASFRKQGMGKTILYVFLLSLLSIIPTSYHFNMIIKDGIRTIQETITTEMPDFEIKNGQLTVEGNEPVILNNNGFSIFIDDSGTLTANEVAAQTKNGLALLPSEFVLVSSGNIQSSPYSFIEGNNKTISSWISEVDQLSWIFLSIILIIFYIFTTALTFLKVTIFAVFGVVFKNALARPLNYAQIWKVTAYCITLPTLFFTIMDFFQATVPFRLSLSWFIIFILLFLTIKEVPNKQDQ